jgi:hypothetical protein
LLKERKSNTRLSIRKDLRAKAFRKAGDHFTKENSDKGESREGYLKRLKMDELKRRMKVAQIAHARQKIEKSTTAPSDLIDEEDVFAYEDEVEAKGLSATSAYDADADDDDNHDDIREDDEEEANAYGKGTDEIDDEAISISNAKNTDKDDFHDKTLERGLEVKKHEELVGGGEGNFDERLPTAQLLAGGAKQVAAEDSTSCDATTICSAGGAEECHDKAPMPDAGPPVVDLVIKEMGKPSGTSTMGLSLLDAGSARSKLGSRPTVDAAGDDAAAAQDHNSPRVANDDDDESRLVDRAAAYRAGLEADKAAFKLRRRVRSPSPHAIFLYGSTPEKPRPVLHHL